MNKIQHLSFVIAVGLAFALCLCFMSSGTVTGQSTNTAELEHRINPNIAPPESLARLPGIGITRAQAIVTYREDFQRNSQDNSAFQNCDDLRKVKGIGPVTARNMCEYLKFNGE